MCEHKFPGCYTVCFEIINLKVKITVHELIFSLRKNGDVLLFAVVVIGLFFYHIFLILFSFLSFLFLFGSAIGNR